MTTSGQHIWEILKGVSVVGGAVALVLYLTAFVTTLLYTYGRLSAPVNSRHWMWTRMNIFFSSAELKRPRNLVFWCMSLAASLFMCSLFLGLLAFKKAG